MIHRFLSKAVIQTSDSYFFRDINGYIFEVVDAGRTPEV